MQQIVCRPGLRPRPTGGAHSAPLDTLAVFKGPTSKERGGERIEGGKGRRKGRGVEKRGESEFVLCIKKKIVIANSIGVLNFLII